MELTSSEIFALISIFGGIGAAWLNSRISIAKLQVEVSMIKEEIKQERESNEKHFSKIYDKLDNILDRLSKV